MKKRVKKPAPRCGFQWQQGNVTYTCAQAQGHIEEGYAGFHEDLSGRSFTVTGKWHYDPNDPYDDGK